MKIRATVKTTEPPEQEDVDDESAWYVPPDLSVEDEHLFEEDKVKYIPPEITVDDDEPVDTLDETSMSRFSPPDFTIEDDYSSAGDDDSSYLKTANVKKSTSSPQEKSRRKRFDSENMQATSWMDKNAKFPGSEPERPNKPQQTKERFKDTLRERRGETNRTFRQDFRGTRVFVQGLSPQTTWQQLKDHFRIAGEVVFASVSMDTRTGESKECGVVQFETTEMAQKAIATMRDHPLDGATLYVREDVQEKEGARLRSPTPPKGDKQSTIPMSWSCADESTVESLSQNEKTEIYSFIRARDEARKRRNYEASDDMREELRLKFGVHLDDRLKMWWVSPDGRRVPQNISEIKGDGRWGSLKPWRQIPTTPENDACINPDLVNGLLTQRDVARREKDFSTADSLLEEARTSPDGDLNLRIHDESRTWRVWTDKPPPSKVMYGSISERKTPAQQCLDIVNEHAPEKLAEVESMLEKFPGREYNILRKLKTRYLKQ
jgi:RNA recognition motif-containing protein